MSEPTHREIAQFFDRHRVASETMLKIVPKPDEAPPPPWEPVVSMRIEQVERLLRLIDAADAMARAIHEDEPVQADEAAGVYRGERWGIEP